MKKFATAFAAGLTGAAIGIATMLAAPAPAEAGGVYWNNNGGGAVVFGGPRYYAPTPYYYGPRYYGGRRGAVVGPNGACARGYYGRGGCVRY